MEEPPTRLKIAPQEEVLRRFQSGDLIVSFPCPIPGALYCMVADKYQALGKCLLY